MMAANFVCSTQNKQRTYAYLNLSISITTHVQISDRVTEKYENILIYMKMLNNTNLVSDLPLESQFLCNLDSGHALDGAEPVEDDVRVIHRRSSVVEVDAELCRVHLQSSLQLCHCSITVNDDELCLIYNITNFISSYLKIMFSLCY